MALDRADDIGNEDGTVDNIEDRNTNRQEVDYTIPVSVPPNVQVQQLAEDPAETEVFALRQYLLKAVLEDTILVVLFVAGEEIGNFLTVAKPPHLRQTLFDGETVGGVEYAYLSISERVRTRTVNGNELKEIQFVDPPYVADADILYASTVEATDLGTNLIDMNLEARRWSTPIALKRYVVWAVDDDIMLVREVGETTGDFVTVARSPELQRSAFDGQQIGIFSYEYQNAIEREVTDTEGPDTEAQVIIPQFDIGTTVIYVMEAQGGTGVTTLVDGFPVDVLLIDVNTGGRMWATAP